MNVGWRGSVIGVAAGFLAWAGMSLPADAGNSCLWALNGICDEARFGGRGACADTTDDSDCRQFGLRCPWYDDGDCDEPLPWGTGLCPHGTDANDCLNPNPGPDSCQSANNNRCEDPTYGGPLGCPPYTDMTDCTRAAAAMQVEPAAPPAPAEPAAPADPMPLVGEVQQQLNRRGYDAGPVDGVMGRQTRGAIRAFQRDHGLAETGQPSMDLLAALLASPPEAGLEQVGPRPDVVVAPASTAPATEDPPATDDPQPTGEQERAGGREPRVVRPALEFARAQSEADIEDDDSSAGPNGAEASGEVLRLRAERDLLRQELEALRVQMEIAEMRQENADLRAEAAALQEELNRLSGADREIADAREEAEQARSEADAASADLERLRAELARREEESQALQEALSAMTEALSVSE